MILKHPLNFLNSFLNIGICFTNNIILKHILRQLNDNILIFRFDREIDGYL